MSELSGKSIIGFRRGEPNVDSFRAVNPLSGEELTPEYYAASEAEVDQAVQLASRAFEVYRQTSPKLKAAFLRKIAENIEGLGEPLVTRATDETALPPVRIRNETARTCNQLRLFAELIEEGSWVDARIDRGDPMRQPLAKPDVRSMLRPLGPVVVFCASNFPLAFSVAGGDTASALAAGNPVVVKAHRAHPGTAELVGLAVSDALRASDLPEGVFSLLFGRGEDIGMQLVRHPQIKAGGFTGSRSGGQALMHAAAARPEPIPFYAEMSSVNPIFLFPDALREREEQIAIGLHASVTLGAGQFCTNPGLVFLPTGADSAGLIERLKEMMASTAAFTIGLFRTCVDSFLADTNLSAEVFGPATLLVTYSDVEQLPDIARKLEGQLTATIHATDAEQDGVNKLIDVIENKAGRIVFNGFPTGVEVCHSMVHGGPFPATSDGRSTSVGTRAALRFVRPFCYQDVPAIALPDELKDGNPLNIWRMVDGELNKAALSDMTFGC